MEYRSLSIAGFRTDKTFDTYLNVRRSPLSSLKYILAKSKTLWTFSILKNYFSVSIMLSNFLIVSISNWYRCLIDDSFVYLSFIVISSILFFIYPKSKMPQAVFNSSKCFCNYFSSKMINCSMTICKYSCKWDIF